METQIGLMRVGAPSQALRAIEQRPVAAAEAPLRVAEEVLAREVAQNVRTWAALTRLGVRDGTELRLDFFYETTGAEADQELADFLEQEGYEVTIEADGIKGRTRPMALSPARLDDWVLTMLCAGNIYGGCSFAGWTATVARPVVQANGAISS